jgi:hypothetical protein
LGGKRVLSIKGGNTSGISAFEGKTDIAWTVGAESVPMAALFVCLALVYALNDTKEKGLREFHRPESKLNLPIGHRFREEDLSIAFSSVSDSHTRIDVFECGVCFVLIVV